MDLVFLVFDLFFSCHQLFIFLLEELKDQTTVFLGFEVGGDLVLGVKLLCFLFAFFNVEPNRADQIVSSFCFSIKSIVLKLNLIKVIVIIWVRLILNQIKRSAKWVFIYILLQTLFKLLETFKHRCLISVFNHIVYKILLQILSRNFEQIHSLKFSYKQSVVDCHSLLDI